MTMTYLLFVGLSANQSSIEIPNVNLTMKGGDKFYVTHPIELVSLQVRFARYRHAFFLLLILYWSCLLEYTEVCSHDSQNGSYVYCLALVKSEDINIIGRKYLLTQYSVHLCSCMKFSTPDFFFFSCHDFECLVT